MPPHRTPTLFIRLKALPREDRPALVHRAFDKTMIYADPTAVRMDIFISLDRQLTSAENDVMCDAYRIPRRGQRGDISHLVNDKQCLLYVPEAVRYPGDPAFQGGAELDRRRRAGLLAEEADRLLDERLARQTG